MFSLARKDEEPKETKKREGHLECGTVIPYGKAGVALTLAACSLDGN